MEDTLISFETAKLAKERVFDIHQKYVYNQYDDSLEIEYIDRGFDEEELKEYINFQTYTQSWLCPTQSLLKRWLREKHNIIIEILMFETTPNYKYRIWVNPEKGKNCSNIRSEEIYNSYEQALEEGLKQALNLI